MVKKQVDQLEEDLNDLRESLGMWMSYGLTSQRVMAGMVTTIVRLGGTAPDDIPQLPFQTRSR